MRDVTRVYRVRPDRFVLIVTYRCNDLGQVQPITISDEHDAAQWTALEDCSQLDMPAGYLNSTRACA